MANYINNERFEQLILSATTYSLSCVEDELITQFDLLVDKILDSYNFAIDRDDAKQDCLLLILKVLKNFDTSKGKAFNYFTTIIINNLNLIFTKEKTYQEKLKKYFLKAQVPGIDIDDSDTSTP